MEWPLNGGTEIITNIFICVSMINKSLVGLERREGEELMTELTFLSMFFLNKFWYVTQSKLFHCQNIIHHLQWKILIFIYNLLKPIKHSNAYSKKRLFSQKEETIIFI